MNNNSTTNNHFFDEAYDEEMYDDQDFDVNSIDEKTLEQIHQEQEAMNQYLYTHAQTVEGRWEELINIIGANGDSSLEEILVNFYPREESSLEDISTLENVFKEFIGYDIESFTGVLTILGSVLKEYEESSPLNIQYNDNENIDPSGWKPLDYLAYKMSWYEENNLNPELFVKIHQSSN